MTLAYDIATTSITKLLRRQMACQWQDSQSARGLEINCPPNCPENWTREGRYSSTDARISHSSDIHTISILAIDYNPLVTEIIKLLATILLTILVPAENDTCLP